MSDAQTRRGNIRPPRDDKAALMGLALLAAIEYEVVGLPLTEEEQRRADHQK